MQNPLITALVVTTLKDLIRFAKWEGIVFPKIEVALATALALREVCV